MKVKDILHTISYINCIGSAEKEILALDFDSRRVTEGCMFFAVKGQHVDGHCFISQAIQAGASVIICEVLPDDILDDITYIQVEYVPETMALVSDFYYDSPSSKLKLVGVTGTNGKTTIATLLYTLFEKLGYKSGLLSTVENKIHKHTEKATLTTTDSITLNKLLSEMVSTGCEYCFMEVSSHAVIQHRITGLQFDGGIFTNLTHDHLDFHQTFDNYIKAKKQFFDSLPGEAFALVNNDDKNGAVMLQNTKAAKYTYALKSIADFQVKILESHFHGLYLLLDNQEFWTQLCGKFNAYNLTAVYAAAVLLHQDKHDILQYLSSLSAVNGRFETLRSVNNISAIIDYAHTPDALLNVLSTINEIRSGNETLIALVGAGGDRDKTKRPEMAKICVDLADKVILTSDNPRTEDPEKIIEDMQQGIPMQLKQKAIKITDRREAIRAACFMAKSGDIILIPGKGHEDYQEINGIRHHFNDKEIVNEIFQQLN